MLLAAMTLLAGGVRGFCSKPFEPLADDPMLEPWRWRVFPELSGLGAQCMAEGADGTIWFGAPEGVWAYNGLSWIWHPTNEGLGIGS
ncbi:MAG TPA: hypothetical protein VK327_03805, partial [Candidatus Paceibacterota bacterium]|nr:hypothetical protein [Candidatus Paceibacterota bacterium]